MQSSLPGSLRCCSVSQSSSQPFCIWVCCKPQCSPWNCYIGGQCCACYQTFVPLFPSMAEQKASTREGCGTNQNAFCCMQVACVANLQIFAGHCMPPGPPRPSALSPTAKPALPRPHTRPPQCDLCQQSQTCIFQKVQHTIKRTHASTRRHL